MHGNHSSNSRTSTAAWTHVGGVGVMELGVAGACRKPGIESMQRWFVCVGIARGWGGAETKVVVVGEGCAAGLLRRPRPADTHTFIHTLSTTQTRP